MLFYNKISLISILYPVFTLQQWLDKSQERCQEEHCHLSQKLQGAVIASKHQRCGAKVASSWNLVIDNHLTDCVEKYNNTSERVECCLRLMTPGSEDRKIFKFKLRAQKKWLKFTKPLNFFALQDILILLFYIWIQKPIVLKTALAIQFRMMHYPAVMQYTWELSWEVASLLFMSLSNVYWLLQNLKPAVVLASSLQKVLQGSCRDAG